MAEEWDVFQMLPGTDAPVLLTTLYEAREKTIRVELNGTGSGSFAINRSSPECTEAILAQGNLVKVRIPEIHTDYIFAFFLETGDFTLISSQEQGGEMLTFGGRGILSYLEYARAWSESYIVGGQDPIAGLWRAYAAGTGSAPGQILRRLLEEFQDPDRPQEPLPHLTIDFDYTNDSTVNPWDETDATDEFTYQVGEDGLAILLRLLETETIRVQMDPDFLLHAYNVANLGRDLTGAAFGAGVVRFERGVNIATELRRELAVDRVATHILVQGEADKYGSAVLAGASTRVTKEAFLAAFGTGTTALNAIGAVDLQERLNVSDLITFQIANRRTAVSLAAPVTVGATVGAVATDGFYLPGPEGTNGDFWVGDTVRIHTGSDAFDYTEVDAAVQAITIAREDDNAELAIFVEAKTEPAPPFEQYGTDTELAAVDFTWPEGDPTPGHLLVGFLAGRGQTSAALTDLIPWSVPSEASNTILDAIPGTDWTYIDGALLRPVPGEFPIVMTYRYPATADDTQWIIWAGITGGTSRPRGHHVERSGFAGPPTVTVKEVSSGFAPFTSPDITVPGAGIIYAGFSTAHSGPSDNVNAWPGFVLDAVAPAVTLTRGYADSLFAPYSWFGYRLVSSAGTYQIDLTLTGLELGPSENPDIGWILCFFPSA